MNDGKFKDLYTKKTTDFIRKRVWGFKEIFVGILHGLTKSLSVQVDSLLKYFELQDLQSSKQAFSKARQKLKYEGFVALNEAFATTYYSDDEFLLYKSYRLAAIDGSDLKLPESADIKEVFGCQNTCGFPMASGSILYDLENRVIIDSHLDKYASSERDQAIMHLDKLVKIDGGRKIPTIIIFDRGYPSILLLCTLISLGIDFVIRFEADAFTKTTKEFAKSGGLDEDIDIELSKLSPTTIAKIKPYITTLKILKLRIIRLLRADKDIFLLTSLTKADKGQVFGYEDFEELYHKRWGIETQYDYLKNVMELENFATKTSLGVYQEFYATILCANIYQLLAQDAAQQVRTEQNQKMKNDDAIKINFAVAAGLSKSQLIDIVFSDKPLEIIYQRLIQKIKQNKVLSKPNRSFQRKVKFNRKFYLCKRPVS